ncbi:stage II sporulation protein P [Desulfotomaculum copahuensis]|uniref:Stage II sporulation protein P n=1 Tax=Desulfotomaculum copahuensis TaxID=1838280 RepID=A0A1B7LF83_9FIRM|nr:stage II sporulation protein P [Desulfotomaculum copahuensis]OAT82315.1 hypothetical protein A6M21_09185 [Desulfotomaculum copahuensis]
MARAIYSYQQRDAGQCLYRRLNAGMAVLFLALLVMAGAAFWSFMPFGQAGRLIAYFREAVNPRGLLVSAMPLLAWSAPPEEIPETVNARYMLAALRRQFFSWQSPRAMLQSQVPLLAALPAPGGNGAAGASAGPPPREQAPAAALNGEYLVAIYHTHTGETYALSDGTAREDGKRGGVVAVGEAVKQVLESKYGTPTLHDETINDANYNTSYMVSEQTARKILDENRHIQVLLDIHRDAGLPRRDCLVKVNGQAVAPLLFIVGSDARAPFPDWRKNYQFAQQLAAAVNKKYPGLVRGVRVKEGRYNQFLHPRALLVEVGSSNNYTSEAVAAGKLFADALGGEVKKIMLNQRTGEQVSQSRPDQGDSTRADESKAQTRGE